MLLSWAYAMKGQLGYAAVGNKGSRQRLNHRRCLERVWEKTAGSDPNLLPQLPRFMARIF